MAKAKKNDLAKAKAVVQEAKALEAKAREMAKGLLGQGIKAMLALVAVLDHVVRHTALQWSNGDRNVVEAIVPQVKSRAQVMKYKRIRDYLMRDKAIVENVDLGAGVASVEPASELGEFYIARLASGKAHGIERVYPLISWAYGKIAAPDLVPYIKAVSGATPRAVKFALQGWNLAQEIPDGESWAKVARVAVSLARQADDPETPQAVEEGLRDRIETEKLDPETATPETFGERLQRAGKAVMALRYLRKAQEVMSAPKADSLAVIRSLAENGNGKAKELAQKLLEALQAQTAKGKAKGKAKAAA